MRNKLREMRDPENPEYEEWREREKTKARERNLKPEVVEKKIGELFMHQAHQAVSKKHDETIKALNKQIEERNLQIKKFEQSFKDAELANVGLQKINRTQDQAIMKIRAFLERI